MATIDIRRASPLGKAATKEKTEQLAKKMEAKLGIVWQWKGDQLSFHTPAGMAKGTTGVVSVDDDSVRVAVDLPLLLRGFKGKVSERIQDELRALLG